MRQCFINRFLSCTLLLCAVLFCSGALAASSVRLAWDPNTEADLAGYRVYYGTSEGNYPQSLDVGNETVAEVQGLLPGRTYYFAVSAYNVSNLEGEFSSPIEFTTPEGPGGPAGPLTSGRYAGLVADGASAHLGSFSFQLNGKGAASGKLISGGRLYLWKGTFDETGKLIAKLPKSAVAQGLALTLEVSAESGVTGTLTGPGMDVSVIGRKATLAPVGIVSPHAGRYTAVIEQAESEQAAAPGFALAKVSRNGRFTFLATLPDGSRCAFSAPVDSSGSIPMFVKPKGKVGGLFGWLTFRDVPEVSDLDGSLSWNRRFSAPIELEVTGARYQVPVGAVARAALLTQVTGAQLTLDLALGPVASLLAPVFGNTFSATGGGGEVITFRVAPTTGLFSGACVPAAGKSVPFNGVLLQKGAFHGTGRTREANFGGRVEIQRIAGS